MSDDDDATGADIYNPTLMHVRSHQGSGEPSPSPEGLSLG